MFNMIGNISLALAFFCAFLIAIDEIRNPQKMWIMNIVWPITALTLWRSSVWLLSDGR